MQEEMVQYVRPNGYVNHRVRWMRVRRQWPLAVWIAACAAAVWTYQRAGWPNSAGSIRGIVDAETVQIAPVETARLKAVLVAEGQSVRAGDVLAEMDTALIDHGISADLVDTIRIETAFGDTHQDVLQAISQRIDSTAAIEADIATCRQEWEREAAELAALEAEQARRDALRERGVIDELARTELLPSIANLKRAVALYAGRMATYERQLREAEAYRANMMEWLGAREGEPISEAIERRLNQREVGRLLDTARQQARHMRDAYQLTAPRDGVVAGIFFRAGDVVPQGIPLMRLVRQPAERLTAYLAEEQIMRLQPGERVTVRSLYREPPLESAARVEAVSAEVHTAAYSLAATGRPVPMRARRAQLRFEGAHAFVGGETVCLLPGHPPWREWVQGVARGLAGAAARGGCARGSP